MQESLEVARQLGDRRALGNALGSLGWLAQQQGAYVEARSLLEAGLEVLRQVGSRSGIALTLGRLGYLAFAHGDRAEAWARYDQSLEIARAVDDRPVLGEVLFYRALGHQVDGELDLARRLYDESRAILESLGHRHALAQNLLRTAHAAAMQGDVATARRLCHDALTIARAAGNRRRLAFSLWLVASLAAEDEPALAVRLDVVARAQVQAMGAVLARPVRDLFATQVARAHQALEDAGKASPFVRLKTGAEPDEGASPERSEGMTSRLAGRALSLEQAVDEALTWLGTTPQDDADPAGARHGTTPPTTPDSAPRQDGTPWERGHPGRFVRASDPLTSGSPDRFDAGRLDPPPSLLTRRERQVAVLLGRGLTNRQIAEDLVVTETTAASYVKRVKQRLGFDTRGQVTAWAVAHRLDAPPGERVSY